MRIFSSLIVLFDLLVAVAPQAGENLVISIQNMTTSFKLNSPMPTGVHVVQFRISKNCRTSWINYGRVDVFFCTLRIMFMVRCLQSCLKFSDPATLGSISWKHNSIEVLTISNSSCHFNVFYKPILAEFHIKFDRCKDL